MDRNPKLNNFYDTSKLQQNLKHIYQRNTQKTAQHAKNIFKVLTKLKY